MHAGNESIGSLWDLCRTLHCSIWPSSFPSHVSLCCRTLNRFLSITELSQDCPLPPHSAPSRPTRHSPTHTTTTGSKHCCAPASNISSNCTAVINRCCLLMRSRRVYCLETQRFGASLKREAVSSAQPWQLDPECSTIGRL